jgi:hypothetical protein
MLSHGELIHEDEARDAEFEDDDELEDEIVDSSEEE